MDERHADKDLTSYDGQISPLLELELDSANYAILHIKLKLAIFFYWSQYQNLNHFVLPMTHLTVWRDLNTYLLELFFYHCQWKTVISGNPGQVTKQETQDQ